MDVCTAVISMTLPFTEGEFLALFGAYNAELWPFALVLWVASAAALVLRGYRIDRAVSTLLAVHWAWSAVAYHLVFFTRINPAAWLFGALFLVQALLFTRVATDRAPLRYGASGTPARVAGLALIAYALAYPLLAATSIHAWPETPSFGVPCPTTLLTAGFLLTAAPLRRALLVIPLLWSLIGGSAALLLGVWTDFALFAAALALLVALVAPRMLHLAARGSAAGWHP
jgi:hypothetical protein